MVLNLLHTAQTAVEVVLVALKGRATQLGEKFRSSWENMGCAVALLSRQHLSSIKDWQ